MLSKSSEGGAPRAAQPGLAPCSATGASGTLFAALYGELRPHRRGNDEAASEDAYSLFYRRSLAMGWLTVSGKLGEVNSVGLWGMNDAGQGSPGGGLGSSLAAWFQVSVGMLPGQRSLPVQPFLCCVDDVVGRLGALQLEAVHLLLPAQMLDVKVGTESLTSSAYTAGWFSDAGPRSLAEVLVTLDSGQDPTIPRIAPELLRWLRQTDQDVFLCDSYSLTDHVPLASRPPFGDHFWHGPPLNRATFRGTLAEWSLDALGWLAALLVDSAVRHGANTPLLLTASRVS